jgi:hypothetical protein
MDHRTQSAAVLGIGLSGCLVAGVVLAIDASAGHGHRAPVHEHAAAPPLCTPAPDAGQPTFYAEISEANARMHEGMEVAPSGNVDRDFLRVMMPHHQGAIDMALSALKFGRDERVKRIAQAIIVEQGQEVAYMRSLLASPIDQTPDARIADK